MPTIDEVSSFLSQRGVEVLEFQVPTPTSVTAAHAVGCEVGAIAKTILFVVGGVAVAVVTSGDYKVKGAKLKRCSGLTGKVVLPTAQEVEAHTGYLPGGVCPFLLPAAMAVYVDASLRRFPVVHAAGGNSNSLAPLTVDRLLEITDGVECDACDPIVPTG
jgi:prolyl-tRNA editing enzyme YbaK/EbsC (Cys-tRNA(Pro) deacylase)